MSIGVWSEWPVEGPGAPRAGEVHLVRAALVFPAPGPPEELRALLSPEERARVERFHRARDGDIYAASHAVLRILLADLTGADPRAIRLRRSSRGKPFLPGARALRFNMSASGDRALYAFAIDREVGVDVERIDERLFDPASAVLSPGERDRLEAIEPRLRTRAFFEAWARTEARLKAAGAGIAWGDAGRGGAGMTIVDCGFEGEYAAALAAPGCGFKVRAWILPAGALLERAA